MFPAVGIEPQPIVVTRTRLELMLIRTLQVYSKRPTMTLTRSTGVSWHHVWSVSMQAQQPSSTTAI